jgi:hypothetical protein
MCAAQDRDKLTPQASPLDGLPATEDLAARIPLAMQELNMLANSMAGQLGANGAVSGHWAADNVTTGGAQPLPGLLDMLSPGAVLSPTSVSMELTNGSLSEVAQHAQRAIANIPPPAAAAPGRPEFTTNITSNVPALSTLLEEDEDTAHGSGSEAAGGGGGAPASHGNMLLTYTGADATVSMDITMPDSQGEHTFCLKAPFRLPAHAAPLSAQANEHSKPLCTHTA